METKAIILRQLNYEANFHEGYGAGNGQVITVTYQCPCGESTVVYDKDDIPAFKSSSIYCACEKCRELYNFGNGYATKK